MDPIVSIIVPVYNAEETLRRCIESVLNQGFTDFELLLVDDGSTDSSAGICREYENGDRRVRVIRKENTGSIGYQESGAFRGPGNIRPVSGQRRLDHTGRHQPYGTGSQGQRGGHGDRGFLPGHRGPGGP